MFRSLFWLSPSGLMIMIPVFILAMVAQSNVKRTFNKYLRVRSVKNITGSEVAQKILRNEGLDHVTINMVSGNMSDHYNPRNRTVNLSKNVHQGTSVASIAVAAHEVGHALQHAKGYSPLFIRNMILPVANFGSKMLMPLFFIGYLLRTPFLMDVGIAFYLAAIIFQVLTLPVEFNASSRAVKMMDEYGFLSTQDEIVASKKVLTAAALTYVASVAVSIAQLIRLLILRNSRD